MKYKGEIFMEVGIILIIAIAGVAAVSIVYSQKKAHNAENQIKKAKEDDEKLFIRLVSDLAEIYRENDK